MLEKTCLTGLNHPVTEMKTALSFITHDSSIYNITPYNIPETTMWQTRVWLKHDSSERKRRKRRMSSVLKETEHDAAGDWFLLGDTNGCDIDKDRNLIACF